MYRRVTSSALCTAVLLVLTAVPASANRVQQQHTVDGGGGVIEPGEALVLFQFWGGDQLHLDMEVWFGLEGEYQIYDPESGERIVDPDCHYSGDTDSNPELSYVDRGTSFLVTIDGPADLNCNVADYEPRYVWAVLEVSASTGEFLTEPITGGDGSLCRGVRHTTDDSGIARAHMEAEGLDPEVVIAAEGTPGSGFYGSEDWICLEPGA